MSRFIFLPLGTADARQRQRIGSVGKPIEGLQAKPKDHHFASAGKMMPNPMEGGQRSILPAPAKWSGPLYTPATDL